MASDGRPPETPSYKKAKAEEREIRRLLAEAKQRPLMEAELRRLQDHYDQMLLSHELSLAPRVP